MLRIAVSIAYLISCLGLTTIGTLANFGVVLGGTLLRGVGSGINWVFSTQLLLQLLPDEVRGRVFSTEFAMLTLMNASGAALGGWALDSTSLGISSILWGMSALTFFFGLLWSLWVFKMRRESI
jgi:predicted MFS family arabinose efflux permease